MLLKWLMRRKKTLQELTIKDNFMFGAVMCDEKNSKDFLEMLFGVSIARVEISKEKCIAYHPEYKGVRLDVFVADENNTKYSIEMQATSEEDITKRTRYYHSQIDMELISTGTEYEELPDVYVIFICDFDPFGKKKYCYTVENLCLEDISIDVSDGSRSIYLSTKGQNETEVSEKLVRFLKYVQADLDESVMDYGDEFVKKLQETVMRVKESREMGERYMTLQEWLKDEYEEGKLAGREEGIREGAKSKLLSMVEKKLAKGHTPEEIADILEEELDVVLEIIQQIKDNN